MYDGDKKPRTKKVVPSDPLQARVKRTLSIWLALAVLHIHDFWIFLCNTAYNIYCACTVKFAKMMQPLRSGTVLLCAHMITSGINDDKSSQVTDITYALLTYYHNDTVLSCFTMQEWLKRFDYNARTVSIVFIRNGTIYRSKLNLDTDTEMLTNSDGIGTELSTLPGVGLTSIVL
jgi:hypothetical protein